MSFDFTELNLSSVEVSTGGRMLKPGRYVCRTSGAKIGQNSNKNGSVIEVRVDDVNGEGGIKHWINVSHPNADAQRIGREDLKNLLFYGGHPNPDRPGAISLLNDLVVGVIVKEVKYTDRKTGVEKTGSEIARFIDPADVDPTKFTPKQVPAKKAGGMNDDIPF